MLFCSSVASEGSVMFAGVATEEAELNGCQWPDNCWIPKTVTADITAAANAIIKIWRAVSLYIIEKLLI
jgi:hypothetical protein